MMASTLGDKLQLDRILPQLKAQNKNALLAEIVEGVAHTLPQFDAMDILNRLLEREGKASTGAEFGVAIPHAALPGLEAPVMCLARSLAGVNFDALDGAPSHLFFTIFYAPGDNSYLQLISTVCRALRNPQLRARLMAASSAHDMLAEWSGRDVGVNQNSGGKYVRTNEATSK